MYLPRRIRVSRATALPAFATSGRVWLASHMKHLTSSRRASCPSVPFGPLLEPQTGWEGVLLPEQTPNVALVFSAKAWCEIVTVPASKYLTKRQPAYHLNSPRLLIGTSRFRSGNRSQLDQTHDTRISGALLQSKTPPRGSLGSCATISMLALSRRDWFNRRTLPDFSVRP